MSLFENGTTWTSHTSHGELLRDGHDESLTIDASNLRFLYQGVDPSQTNVEYFQLPYKLGLLTFEGHGESPQPGGGEPPDPTDNPTDGVQVLIDVAAVPRLYACYETPKQSLNPPPEDDALCPAALNPAVIEVSEEDGNPPPSLRLEIPFDNYNQLVELEWEIPAEHRNMTGKRLVLPLKVVELGFTNAMCPGGVRFFVKTGNDYAYGSAPWIPVPLTTGDTFREYPLNLANAELGSGVQALDLTFVRSVGIAFESADCGGFGTWASLRCLGEWEPNPLQGAPDVRILDEGSPWPMLRHMPGDENPAEARRASLFRNGRNQAVRIPKAFELPGDEVMVHREGNRLIIEPITKKRGLLAVLAELEPLDDELSDVDEGLLSLDDINLEKP